MNKPDGVNWDDVEKHYVEKMKAEGKAAQLIALERHRPHEGRVLRLSHRRIGDVHRFECGCGQVIEVSNLEACASIGAGP